MNLKPALLLLLILLPISLEGFAVFDSWSRDWSNGNKYEVVWCEGVTWREASDYAASKMQGRIRGHLATITSAEENHFILKLLNEGFPYQAWIGGKQTSKNKEPAGGWVWVNEEGTIPYNNKNFFTNWLVGEPNNYNGIDMSFAM